MKSLREDIRNVISASHPIVYFRTDEEIEVIELISQAAADYLLFSYDEVDGVRWLNERNYKNNRRVLLRVRNQLESLKPDFLEALSFIRDISRSERTIFVVLSADTLMKEGNPQSQKSIRFIKNLVNEIKSGDLASDVEDEESLRLSIFLISDKLLIPSLLEKDILVFEADYPSRDEIREILDEFLEEQDLFLSDDLKMEFVSALQGLTRSEIRNLLYLARQNNNVLDERDVDLFIDYKKQIVRKNAIIEYIDVRKLPTDIGGLKNLKEWLERKRDIFKKLDTAIKYGVDIPKGVLLFGMPGCGKSLASKYTAKLMGLPLLRLDMGRIMGPYLGQSEENLRKAIKIAESIAPSILWIDEIEKALAGVKGGSSDTVVRIFGALLTWMQEKEKPVFVIATANDISAIPPEFLRKGRFDEIFFVDFPDDKSIKEIFKIHFKKRGKNTNSIDLERVLEELRKKLNELEGKLSNHKGSGGQEDFKVLKKLLKEGKGYSGADIESIVSEVVENAFLNDKETISTEDVIAVVRKSKPIVETLKDKIGDLYDRCEKIGAQPAD